MARRSGKAGRPAKQPAASALSPYAQPRAGMGGRSPGGPEPQAYGPPPAAFGPDGVQPQAPPVSSSETAATSLAPLPIVDKFPIVVGSGLSFAYLSAAQRTALTGYRMNYVDLLREILERDPHLYAVVWKRILAVASSRFEIIPPELPADHPDRERAQEIADDINQRVRAIPALHRHIAFLGWAIFYALTGLEIHWSWSLDAGWGVARFGFIHSRRLSYPDMGSWDLYIWDQGMVLGADPYGDSPTNSALYGLRVGDFPQKFIIHAPQISGDYPTREGVGRLVAEWALAKRLGIRNALQYLERFVKPWPMVTFNTADPDAPNDVKGGPRIATQEDIGAAESALQSLGEGSLNSYTHADSIKVDVVTPDQNRPKVTFREHLEICNAELSKGALGQTLTTEAGSHGGNSRGLGKVHQDEQKLWLEYDACEMAETLGQQLLRPLTLLNHRDASHLVPQWKIHLEESDPMALMELAEKGAKNGIHVDGDAVADDVGLKVVPPKAGEGPRRMMPMDVTAPAELDPELTPEPGPGTAAGAKADAAAKAAEARANAPAFGGAVNAEGKPPSPGKGAAGENTPPEKKAPAPPNEEKR